jgi:hypothetical protein
VAEFAHPDAIPHPHRYPNPDFQYIYDVCALHAHRTGGAVGVLASAPIYTREMLSRLGERGRQLESGSVYDCIIWLEPSVEDAETGIAQIAAALRHGGTLCVMAAGLLASRLTERRQKTAVPAGTPLGWTRTARLLTAHHFTIQRVYRFHGLSSVLYGVLSGVMLRYNRLELADRWLYRMRRSFAAGTSAGRMLSPLDALSTVGVIVAQHEANA